MPLVIQSPILDWIEGETGAFTITVTGENGGTPTLASPSCKVYNNESDTSSANLTTPAASVNGNVITTGVLQALKGGETYWLATTVTVDGFTRVFLLEIRVAFPWGAS
jgi:hypothetical protein